MKLDKKTITVYAFSLSIIVIVSIIDFLTPLGLVAWLGYQLSIFISYRTLPRRYVYALAVISTMLIVLGLYFSPSNISYDIALTNRLVGISLLWVTTILLVLRRQAEEQIQEQSNLLDKAHDAIILLDLNYRYLYWNKGAERMYGYLKKEILGTNAKKLLYDTESSQFIEVKNSLEKKGKWIGELHQIKKDGEELIVESSWTLVRESNQEPKSILIINTDITEQKKMEMQFFRAQRMESIGTLAAGITHDINNVLSPIMLSLELLQEKFSDEDSQKLIRIIASSAQRGANLIKQVQLFARGLDSEHVDIPVAHLIFEINQIIKETFPKNIEIRTEIQKDLWAISGDPTQLNQVLMNLCVNARDAMPDGGILRISAENLFIEKDKHINSDAKSGPYIVISISDSGIGIPIEIQDRIFDPFFTTKEPGKGTGLGLSTSHTILKSHGGSLNVSSEVNKGTTFKINLPALNTNETKKEEMLSEHLVGHGELILFVDDEAQIREITKATLEENGYKVCTANDGKEAIALYSQYRNTIKLVIIDMMMPVMDGQTSIKKLRKMDPDIKIIAVSGYTRENNLEQVARVTGQVFLAKPYTAKILLNKIHEILNAKE